jgi:hypothetical protein
MNNAAINLSSYCATETISATGANLAVSDGYFIQPHDWALVTGGGDWDERRAAEYGYLAAMFEHDGDEQRAGLCRAALVRIKARRGI